MQGLTHIHQILNKTDELLERHLDGYHRVPRCFDPYDHDAWMTLLKDVHRTFGRPSERWQWSNELDLIMRPESEVTSSHGITVDSEKWAVVFYFREESDAVMFSLKY